MKSIKIGDFIRTKIEYSYRLNSPTIEGKVTSIEIREGFKYGWLDEAEDGDEIIKVEKLLISDIKKESHVIVEIDREHWVGLGWIEKISLRERSRLVDKIVNKKI